MKYFRKFAKSENGTLSMEAVICFPLLLWAFVATFVFFDIFYARNVNMKAAYTIADALSRESEAVNDAYMGGMEDMLTFLIKGQHQSRMRITTVVYDQVHDEFEVEWSYASDDGWSQHTSQTLLDYWDQIPPLAKGDTAIIVETEIAYMPMMNVGIPPLTMSDFVVTRPRFGPQLVWEQTGGGVVTADGEADEQEEDVIVPPIEDPPAT